MTCRALRPRGRPTPLPNTRCRMVSSGQIKPSTIPQCILTGLYHFSPKAYGLSPLCLRLTGMVAHTGLRLDTKCGGSPLLGRHLQPLANTAPRGAQLVSTQTTDRPGCAPPEDDGICIPWFRPGPVRGRGLCRRSGAWRASHTTPLPPPGRTG